MVFLMATPLDSSNVLSSCGICLRYVVLSIANGFFVQTRLRKSEVEEMARMVGTELIDNLEVRRRSSKFVSSMCNFLRISSSTESENRT